MKPAVTGPRLGWWSMPVPATDRDRANLAVVDALKALWLAALRGAHPLSKPRIKRSHVGELLGASLLMNDVVAVRSWQLADETVCLLCATCLCGHQDT